MFSEHRRNTPQCFLKIPLSKSARHGSLPTHCLVNAARPLLACCPRKCRFYLECRRDRCGILRPASKGDIERERIARCIGHCTIFALSARKRANASAGQDEQPSCIEAPRPKSGVLVDKWDYRKVRFRVTWSGNALVADLTLRHHVQSLKKGYR